MKRTLFFLYGVLSYASFLCLLLYTIGFLAGVEQLPKTVDSGTATGLVPALLANLGLVALFGLQHTGMARPTFKAWWKRVVPEPIERSTYVLLSNVGWAAVLWFWQPLPQTVWSVDGVGATALWALFAAGWAVLVSASFVIDHFDLFGLRQVTLHLFGRPYTPVAFRTRAYYKIVRHPLMVGWLLGFWATPHMTLGHLVFAALNSAYIFVGVFFEERTLLSEHGAAYDDYRKSVSMILPLPKRRPAAEAAADHAA